MKNDSCKTPSSSSASRFIRNYAVKTHMHSKPENFNAFQQRKNKKENCYAHKVALNFVNPNNFAAYVLLYIYQQTIYLYCLLSVSFYPNTSFTCLFIFHLIFPLSLKKKKDKKMTFKFPFLAIALCLSSVWYTPISAMIFPNESAIPPEVAQNGTVSGPWDEFKKFNGSKRGEKSDGLSKLKNYFNNFGYIPDSPSNFTDDFDEQLESAIKTYQKNFNLNVTGKLDDQTLQNVMKSRCGNADVVNGTSTMNSGKHSSSSNSSTKLHTVAHYSFFEGTPTWPEDRRDLTYAFLPDNNLSDTTKEVFTRAFQRWAAVTTLTFTETDLYFVADLKVAFYVGDHGDGEPFDGVLGTLGHSFSPTSGWCHLDGSETWVAEGDVTKSSVSSAIDLESVAVHEIGHLLGLGHSSVEEAIMYPTLQAKTRKVELASDDIEGIQELYGANPNYTTPPSSTTSSNEKDASDAGDHSHSRWRWGLGMLSAVALGLLLL